MSFPHPSGDLAGAVRETEEIVEQYKCLPMRVETLINLIHSCGEDGRWELTNVLLFLFLLL